MYSDSSSYSRTNEHAVLTWDIRLRDFSDLAQLNQTVNASQHGPRTATALFTTWFKIVFFYFYLFHF
jgi:hypothetical protein